MKVKMWDRNKGMANTKADIVHVTSSDQPNTSHTNSF